MKSKTSIYLIIVIPLFLFACKNTKYKHYQNTKWDGLYGGKAALSVLIDKVQGNTFEGEIHWYNGKTISYIEGSFSGDSINFEEKDMVIPGNLVLNGTYPALIVNDTMKGAWIHATHDWSGTPYYVVLDKSFTEKTNDQKIFSSVYNKIKPLKKEMSELLPERKNPFTELNDSAKQVYAQLMREKRDITKNGYEKLEDEELKKSYLDRLIYETLTLWKLAKNSADSLLIMNEVNSTEEGKDGYYSKQQLKVRMSNGRNAYKNFITSMLDKKLSLKDQVSLLFDMIYSLEDNPEFEPLYLKKYTELKESQPAHEMLPRLDKVYKAMLVAKKMQPGAVAPNFEVETIDGNKVMLSDFKGKFVFIDFWGTWCGPCRGEIPYIIKLTEDISNKQLQVLGLASDTHDAVKKYIEEVEITYPNAIANDELLATYGISSFPTTFLINPEGKIAAKNLRGENLTELVKEKMTE